MTDYSPTGLVALYLGTSRGIPVMGFDGEGYPLVLDAEDTRDGGPRLRRAIDLGTDYRYGRLWKLKPVDQPGQCDSDPPWHMVTAGPGWRVRITDESGESVVVPVAAWGGEDGTWPWVVNKSRRWLMEPHGDYVILQPDEPDDAQVDVDDEEDE